MQQHGCATSGFLAVWNANEYMDNQLIESIWFPYGTSEFNWWRWRPIGHCLLKLHEALRGEVERRSLIG